MRNQPLTHQHYEFQGKNKRLSQTLFKSPNLGSVYWAGGQGSSDLRTNFSEQWFTSEPLGLRRYNITNQSGYVFPNPVWPTKWTRVRVPRVVRIHGWVYEDRWTEKWGAYISAVQSALAGIDNLYVLNTRNGSPPTDYKSGRFMAAFTPRNQVIPGVSATTPDFLGGDVLNILIYQTLRTAWYWGETDRGAAYEIARAAAPSIIDLTYPNFIAFNKSNDVDRFKRAWDVFRGNSTWFYTDSSITGAGPVTIYTESDLHDFEADIDFQHSDFLDCHNLITEPVHVSRTYGTRTNHTIGISGFDSEDVTYCLKDCGGICQDEVFVGTLDTTDVDDTTSIQTENETGLSDLADELSDWNVSYAGELTLSAAQLAQAVKDYFGIT